MQYENRFGCERRSLCGITLGWAGLALGVAALWCLTFVVLPQVKKIPIVEPIMEAIAKSDIDAGTYWYTDSEETAYGAMYVRHVLDSQEHTKQ
ncbi:MAG: hypothetical protein ACOC24_05535 [Desulfovibrionales bacterium]